MYLGVDRYGTRYKRIFTGIEKIFSETGGFFVGAYALSHMVVLLGSSITFQTKMIQIIMGNFIDNKLKTDCCINYSSYS